MEVARAVPGFSCLGSLRKIAVQLSGDLRRYSAVSVQHKPRLLPPEVFYLHPRCSEAGLSYKCTGTWAGSYTDISFFGKRRWVLGALRSCSRCHPELLGTDGDAAVPSRAAPARVAPAASTASLTFSGTIFLGDSVVRLFLCHHCNFRA